MTVAVPVESLEFLEFHYRARFASRSLVPGAHASRIGGSGIDVAAPVPLHRAREARRLDLAASLRDPFGGWWAREHHQRASIAVLLLVDSSASVLAAGGDRRGVIGSFTEALRHSAARSGDAFGLIAFDEQADTTLLPRPARSRAAMAEAVQRLAAHGFAGSQATGVLQAAALLPRQPALVFLLSDFCWPPALLDDALASMQRHDVMPLWLDDAGALERLPSWGLLPLRDAESGQRRLLWLRPALHRRWAAARQAHRQAVRAAFARHERVPLLLGAAFDADALSGYFAARG